MFRNVKIHLYETYLCELMSHLFCQMCVPHNLIQNWQTLSSSITASDWSRFKNHASLVRRIDDLKLPAECREWSVSISEDIWTQLLSFANGKPLLPFLRTAEVTLDKGGIEQYRFLQVIPPGLRQLEVELVESGDSLADERHCSAMLQMLKQAPRLEHFHVMWGDSGEDRPGTHPDLLSAFSALSNLRFFDQDGLVESMDGLRILASCPVLEHLGTGVSIVDDVPFQPFTGFRNLKSLKLLDDCPGPRSIKHLFATLARPSQLQSLRIWTTTELSMSLNTWSDLCVSVATLFPSLSSIDWTLPSGDMDAGYPHHDNDDNSTSSRFLLDAIRPLLSLQSLACVKIDFRATTVEFTDACFAALSAAWPALTTLSMQARAPATPAAAAGVTLHTLAAFAARCPQLVYLRLPNMSVSGGPPAGLLLAERPHGLRSLHVACVPGVRKVKMGPFVLVLHQMFPNVCVEPRKGPRVLDDYKTKADVAFWRKVDRKLVWRRAAARRESVGDALNE